MDRNECDTVIPAAQMAKGMPPDVVLQRLEEAGATFGANVKAKFGDGGEGEH